MVDVQERIASKSSAICAEVRKLKADAAAALNMVKVKIEEILIESEVHI